MTEFDAMAQQFTLRVAFAAGWRENYFGAANATRLREAIRELKSAIKDAEQHPEIGEVRR